MSAAPRDIPALIRVLTRVRLPGHKSATVERARKLLLIYCDTARSHGVPFADLVRQLASGMAALRMAGADLDRVFANPAGPAATAACGNGCAFCCILNGADGGLVSRAEAHQVAEALAPFAGQPDGRAWHPQACAALDPETKSCRIYESRPLLCRTYLSDSVAACESNAAGTPASGAGVVGSQGLYLAAMALARAALKGVATVETYALDRVAAAAVAGADPATALRAARHKPRALEDERARLSV
ncbi:YkgJ family cysteine cluster protein [Thalassococcus sp. CAU 1522]|uniref:YkgJ family cysteine cluster protein n=1 Tax=Thalassococcus arenae TaxID=2851652 RepID=A0ABS6NCH5_9RHOB|nr:YkgJ family cysteine cluster protein [Thalassococcus arenae]MBV2361720.1 YkgJ family cysteine cluster protein [Thalassococcus arenae]